jgi:hypothetical protein
MLSLYSLQTATNHPDIFLKIYPQNKYVFIFFVAYCFWTIYLIVNIVVSIVYITYKRYYADIINKLPNDRSYSKILVACYDETKQVVVLDDVAKMSETYLEKGDDMLDMIIAKHYQDKWLAQVQDPLPDETKKRDTGCRLFFI